MSGLRLLSLDDVAPFDEAPETGATFEENALAKARDAFVAIGLGLRRRRLRAGRRRAERHAGRAVGAVVGDARRRRRQHRLAAWPSCGDVPDERRGAAFVSACALVSAAGETVVRGEWSGAIAGEPRGDGRVRLRPDLRAGSARERSAAELSPAEKDAASHRGRALALLVPALRALA